MRTYPADAANNADSMRFHRRYQILLLLLTCCLFALAAPARAQELRPRFGVGFNAMVSTADLSNFLGLGLRGRVAAPINQDLSIGLDLGFTGFLLGGRNDASYIFDPQVSAIITLPGDIGRAPYILAGIGAYVPLSDEEEGESSGGPTIHGGIGWVQTLSETTFYYEVDPALIIGADLVHVALPVRLGLIF